MKTFILLALFVAVAMSAPSAFEDNQAAAHLRNKRSQYTDLLNNLLELAERQEQAEAESNDLINALAVMEEYGLLDNEEVAALQDYVDQAVQQGPINAFDLIGSWKQL